MVISELSVVEGGMWHLIKSRVIRFTCAVLLLCASATSADPLATTQQPTSHALEQLLEATALSRTQPIQAKALWQTLDPHQLPPAEVPHYFVKGYILLRNQGDNTGVKNLIAALEQFRAQQQTPELDAIAQLVNIEEARKISRLFRARYMLQQFAATNAHNGDPFLHYLYLEEASEVFKDLGQIDQAAAALEQAFEIIDQHPRWLEYRRIRLLISSATLLRRSGNFSEARLNVQAAYDLAQQNKSVIDQMEALLELSALEQDTGHTENVQGHLDQALAIAKANQNIYFQIKILNQLANYQFKLQKPTLAQSYSEQAIGLAKAANYPLERWISTFYLGTSLIQKGQIQLGLITLKPAMDYLSDIDNQRLQLELLTQLAERLVDQKAFREAVKVLSDYRLTSDKLLQNNQQWLLQQYQTQIEANQLRQQADELQLRNRLKQAEVDQAALQQQRLLLVAISLLMAIILLGLLLHKLRATNKNLYQTNKQLSHKSRTDRLTQLLNRGALLESLFAADHARRQSDSQQSDGLVFLIDIDHFKQVNDTWGHAAGDEVLKQVASTLTENVRRSDLVARWGGEEFVLITPDTDMQQGLLLADKLLHAINERQTPVGHRNLRVTVSIGISPLPKSIDQSEFEFHLGLADGALYYSKQKGRNRATAVLSHQLAKSDISQLAANFESYTQAARVQITSVTGPAL